MRTQPKANLNFSDDEIVFPDILGLIARYRWLIVITSSSAAIIAWIISALFIPQQYQSSATLAIVPVSPLAISSNSADQILLDIPDASVLAAQAQEADFNLPEDGLFEREAKPLEEDRIIFDVIASDPDGAAQYADLWAQLAIELFVEEFGANRFISNYQELYGTSAFALTSVEELLVNRSVSLLNVRQEYAINNYTGLQSRFEEYDGLLESIKSFRGQLEREESNAQLGELQLLEYEILYRRAVNADLAGGLEFDISFDDSTVGSTLHDLGGLDSFVQRRRLEVEKDLLISQEVINGIAREQELILLLQDAKLAKIISPAQVPERPISASPFAHAVLAGGLGIFFNIFIILLNELYLENYLKKRKSEHIADERPVKE